MAFKVIVDLDDFVFATFMEDKLKEVILGNVVNVKIDNDEEPVALEMKKITKIQKTSSNLARSKNAENNLHDSLLE